MALGETGTAAVARQLTRLDTIRDEHEREMLKVEALQILGASNDLSVTDRVARFLDDKGE